MNRALTYVLAVVPQFTLVAGLAVREEHLLATGTSIVLEVRPFDPMDPLSGRYLATPLAIENIDPAQLRQRGGSDAVASDGLGHGNAVWVVLAPGEKYWEPVAVRTAPPALAAGQVCLRGRVGGWTGSLMADYGNVLEVGYAIDRFYIPANGRDPSGRTDLALRVRVNASGSAAVEDLLVGGRSYSEWSR